MSNLFSGLEAFGLGNMKNLEVYGSEEKSGKRPGTEGEEKAKVAESDLIFDKTYTCC